MGSSSDMVAQEIGRLVDMPPAGRRRAYVFFTSGLLHAFAASRPLLPDWLDVRVVASALREEELAWLHAHAGAPVLHIEQRCDDQTIWDHLFALETASFAWIDVDALIWDAALVEDLFAALDQPRVSVAGVFHQEPVPLICTPVSGISVAAVREVERTVGPVSPATYRHRFDDGPAGELRLASPRGPLTEEQRRRFALVFPLDAAGLPATTQSGLYEVYDDRFFRRPDGRELPAALRSARRTELVCDPLFVYQAIAMTLGLGPRAIRPYRFNDVFQADITHVRSISTFRPEVGLPEYGAGPGDGDAREVTNSLMGKLPTLALDAALLERFCERWALPGYVALLERSRDRVGGFGITWPALLRRAHRLAPALGTPAA